jgi:FtsP/CotA-like multicopper oxidase with cupredoxin domain
MTETPGVHLGQSPWGWGGLYLDTPGPVVHPDEAQCGPFAQPRRFAPRPRKYVRFVPWRGGALLGLMMKGLDSSAVPRPHVLLVPHLLMIGTLLALLLPGCNSDPAVTPTPSKEVAPSKEPDDGFIRLHEAADQDPDPKRVEVSLVAKESSVEVIDGRPRRQQTYNGRLPGPLIRAKRGDTLKVNFRNELSNGTTIHWHGMRLPNGMDGVPGVTQDVVEPGEGFVYEYPLLDASVFWYHPHFQTLEQVGAGLYGAVLVEDPDEEDYLGEETVFAISDISLFEDGTPQQHPETDETTLLGREGATLLLNGHSDQVMRVVSGTRLRWRVLNMARSRYLELALEGHEFTRIGVDGGRIEYPIVEETTRLAPGERVDVIVEPRGKVGSHLNLVTLPVDRGPGASTAPGPEILLRIEFIAGKAEKLPPLDDLDRDLDEFDFEDAKEVEIGLTADTIEGQLVMGINGIPYSKNATPIPVVVGQPQVWAVKNETAHSHPFHMHGFHFQVLEADGTFRSPLSYKDTIDVPPRETLRLVPRFEPQGVGKWMFHCHILDHAESGMMGVLHLVEDESQLAPIADAGATAAFPVEAGTSDVPRQLPPEGVEAYLAELLESKEYRNAPWLSETSRPRAPNSIISPHGDVRVYANDVLRRSIGKGNGVRADGDGGLQFSVEARAHDPGSIAVKEFYEDGDVIGKAALMKLEGSTFDAAYYCTGPSSRCGTAEPPPVFGEGITLACGFCHAGFVYTVNYSL